MSSLGNQKLRFAALKVDAPDPAVGGRGHIDVRVRHAGIAIAGTRMVQPPEVASNRPAPVRAQRVDGRRQLAPLAGHDVHDDGAEPIAIGGPLVPNHLASRLRAELKHTPLLPIPGGRSSDLRPAVAIFQVNETEADLVAGLRRTVLECGLHPEHVSRTRVELQFVVVAEPMEAGALGDCPHPDIRGGVRRAKSAARRQRRQSKRSPGEPHMPSIIQSRNETKRLPAAGDRWPSMGSAETPRLETPKPKTPRR
jgi:hypothetical protein